ncbi:MAG: hypothetical protein AABW90_01510 [Nanoarchaeota archaeon]
MKQQKINLVLINLILLIGLIGLVTSLILVEMVSAANADSLTGPYYYNIELYYDKGNIEIKSIKVEFSNEEKSNFNKDNSYYLEIADSEKMVLNKIFFSVPNFAIYDFADEQGNFIETNESGLKILENVSFNVFASYYENGHDVIVYNKNDKELDRNFVSQFSKTGFNKEDFKELKDGEEKQVVKEELERERKDFYGLLYNYYIIIPSLILAILIIVLIYFLSKKK